MTAPGLLLAALLCAEVAAVVLAWRLDRDSLGSSNASGVRPKAPGPSFPVKGARGRYLLWLLTFALADELACLALHAALDGAPRPLAGWARAAWHVSIALSLGWPAVLAWGAHAGQVSGSPKSSPMHKHGGGWPGGKKHSPPQASGAPHVSGWITTAPASLSALDAVTSRRASRSITSRVSGLGKTLSSGMTRFLCIVRASPLAALYLGALAGLAIVYPPSRAGLRWTLLAWELACVAVAWWGLWRARGRTWGAVEVCLVVLVACESAVCIVGPFASDPFLRWWIARCFYLGAWGLVSAVLIKRRG